MPVSRAWCLRTAALTDRAFLEQACREFPQRILLGLDARDGKVAVKGWTAVSETKAIDLLKDLAGLAISAVIYTDISRDGMLSGPNISALQEVVEQSAFPVIASGGITWRICAVYASASHQGAIVGRRVRRTPQRSRDSARR
jgi:phosphoribosylformimino-5-aminoimidazole carboxamide ribotide isomerase